MTLTAPALLTYSYFPLAGAHAPGGRFDLDEAWHRIGDDLGLGEPVEALGVPTELPAVIETGGSGVLAARGSQRPEVGQARVWVERDVACLGLLMAPPRARDCAAAWVALEDRVDRLALGGGLLGQTRLFLGLSGGQPDPHAVRAAVPQPAAMGWWRSASTFKLGAGDEAMLWEVGAHADGRALRRLLLVAPEEAAADLDRLAWSTGPGGPGGPTPLARHLVHAARLRYQLRVFRNGRDTDLTCGLFDELEGELFGADDKHPVRARLARAYEDSELLHDRMVRMRRGARSIAGSLGTVLPDPVAVGPVAEDRELVTWFTGRLGDEIGRLEAARAQVRLRLETPLAPGSRVTAREPVTPTENGAAVMTAPAEERPELVFISYIHDSEAHKSDVRQLAELLHDNGIAAELDQWAEGERQDWSLWALRLLGKADFVIVVASALCRDVGDGRADPDQNWGGQSELVAIRELLHRHRATWTRKLLPVVLPGRSADEIPMFLQGWTADHYQVSDFTSDGAEGLLRTITGQPRHRRPPLGPRIRFPQHG
jgi:hypothetical protein